MTQYCLIRSPQKPARRPRLLGIRNSKSHSWTWRRLPVLPVRLPCAWIISYCRQNMLATIASRCRYSGLWRHIGGKVSYVASVAALLLTYIHKIRSMWRLVMGHYNENSLLSSYFEKSIRKATLWSNLAKGFRTWIFGECAFFDPSLVAYVFLSIALHTTRTFKGP